MAIERRAVKKRKLKSGRDRTDTAVYVLLKYGVVSDADQAFKIVSSKDEVLMPSDLSYYTDQVEQDLGMGRSSLEVVQIRNALAEFYGLYEPEEDDAEPDELDDLLGSIREELEEPSAPPSSALAIYEGVGGEDIVDEEIDERILNLLKLDGVHDIDYATYLTLLKERMVASRMVDSSMPTEEIELLTDEFKRVKGKVGRFKLKKKKTITAEDMGTTGPVTVSDDQFFLASSAVIPGKSADSETEDDAEILKKLDDILTSLKMENKEEKKKAKKDKKDSEEAKRRAKEKKLEAKKKKEFASLIKNVVAPVTSLLEKIINWIKWTFIGFIFNQALKWFQDPANQNKVKAIGAFLKAFFPAILAAAVLFLTPFGAFIRSTIKLLRWAVPKLLGIIKKHPRLAAAAALFGAGAMIPQLFPGTVDAEEQKTAKAPGTNAEKIAALKKQKENLNPLQIIQGVGSEIDEQIKFLETGQTASYGMAPAGRTTPGGGADLDDMPTIEGMSGGGEVGNVVNNYGLFNGRSTYTPIFGLSGGGIALPNVLVPNMNTDISLMSGGGLLNVNDIRFSGGGGVTGDTGVDVKGAGADTQLVALQPGEVVMSKSAVNYWGANTLLGMNKAGGGTNVPKMANNIQMAAGGGMVGSTLDPTKTAASMPHVFAAAQQARAKARAQGLPPSEVEKRVIAASERAKAQGPKVSGAFGSTLSMDGLPTPDNSNYSATTSSSAPAPAKDYKVSAPIVANAGTQSSSSPAPAKSIPTTGSMPSSPFKSERLNKALTGITADSWKKSSSAEKIEAVEPASKVISNSEAKTNPLTSELTLGGSTTPPMSKPGMDYSSAIKISSIGSSGSKAVKTSIPQSMAPVSTPIRNSKPTVINLPTKMSSAAPPTPSSPSSPDIPKFSPVKLSGKRNTTINALGIADLVGQ